MGNRHFWAQVSLEPPKSSDSMNTLPVLPHPPKGPNTEANFRKRPSIVARRGSSGPLGPAPNTSRATTKRAAEPPAPAWSNSSRLRSPIPSGRGDLGVRRCQRLSRAVGKWAVLWYETGQRQREIKPNRRCLNNSASLEVDECNESLKDPL